MTDSYVYMPDGNQVWLPPNPRTWVDSATGVWGDALRAPLLVADASAATAWHRQRPLYQGAPYSAQSISSGTWTAITGHTELIDNYASHSDSTNTGRYYAPRTIANTTNGDWYLCSGYVPFNSNDAAHVHIAGLRVNGAGTNYEGGKVPGGTSHVVDTMVLDLVQLNGAASDYVELMGWQNTGASVNTVVSGKTPSFTVRWVAADPAWSGFFTPSLPGVPHTWTSADTLTASATGGAKVPLNTELRDAVRWYNNPPIARVTSEGTSQTIPNGAAWTSVNMTAETVDTYGGHSNSTNNSRYTFQRDGLYLVAGYCNVAEGNGGGTNNGYRAIRLLHTIAAGGTQTYAGWTVLPQTGTGTTGTGIYAVALVRAATNDYIETQLSHTQTNATTARAVNGSAGGCARMISVWLAA